MFCRSLFVLLLIFFWPLCCLLFFDIRILITPLVSSNSSLTTHALRHSLEIIFRHFSSEYLTIRSMLFFYSLDRIVSSHLSKSFCWILVIVTVVVLNATFNNISAISWRSVLFMEESSVPGENNRPAARNWQTLSHNVVSSTPRLGYLESNKN